MCRDLARGTPRSPRPSAPICRSVRSRRRVIAIPVPIVHELVGGELADAWDRGTCRHARGLCDAATEAEDGRPPEAAATAGEDCPDHEERSYDDQRDPYLLLDSGGVVVLASVAPATLAPFQVGLWCREDEEVVTGT